MLRSGELVTVFVVLGCRPGAPELRGAALRRVEACALAFLRDPERSGALVLCSGGRAWDGVVEADAFAAALRARGVAEAQIVRERCSMTTGENARYTAGLLARRVELGFAEALRVRLVTCDWHMPRAALHFRDAGLFVTEEQAASPGGALARAARTVRERAARWLDTVVA